MARHDLSTREGYMEALSVAEANANDTVSEGEQDHKPAVELAAAHVILDAIAALRTKLDQGATPWSDYKEG